MIDSWGEKYTGLIMIGIFIGLIYLPIHIGIKAHREGKMAVRAPSKSDDLAGAIIFLLLLFK